MCAWDITSRVIFLQWLLSSLSVLPLLCDALLRLTITTPWVLKTKTKQKQNQKTSLLKYHVHIDGEMWVALQ